MSLKEKAPSATKAEEEINIAGGWSGQDTGSVSTPHPSDKVLKKKGNITLRGVVQKGASGMRIQVYDNPMLKQVEVIVGSWANGIREGDIIRLLGYWRNKSYVKATRIHNETTGVDFKPSSILGIIALIIFGIIGVVMVAGIGAPPIMILALIILIVLIIIIVRAIRK